MSIKQPKNTTSTKGDVTSKLIWNNGFKANASSKFDKIQAFIDSEVIRLMKPYTPFRSGTMERSATLGTKIGSGKIIYNSPYARYQYYGKLMVSSKTGSSWSSGEYKVLTDKDLVYSTSRHAQAGSYWFERMKADHKKKLLASVERMK